MLHFGHGNLCIIQSITPFDVVNYTGLAVEKLFGHLVIIHHDSVVEVSHSIKPEWIVLHVV